MRAVNTFYCSTLLGGCGGELIFAIGDVNVPHFRHQRGSVCSLTASQSVADRYKHLAMQEALRSRIESMPGFTCRLEATIESGRTDVLATGPSFAVALEVQRSRLHERRATERTLVYAQGADAVDWLYADRDIDAHKAELANRGWSLRIWYGWAKRECRIGVRYESNIDPELEYKEICGPLADWEITSRGLDSEHLRTARATVTGGREALRQKINQEASAAARRAAIKAEKEAAARLQEATRQRNARAQLLNQLQQTPDGLEEKWPTSWPELQGSPKQVHWAEELRARVIGWFLEELEKGWLDENRGIPVARWLALQTQAKFWIEICGHHEELVDVLHWYEDLFGRPIDRFPGSGQT
ncbi:competence protein CoiA family protein [Paenarthrobacter sp. RAF54_2]